MSAIRSILRIATIAVLALVVLFLITLALPVRSWRTGEPEGPRFDETAVPPQWPRPLRLWVDTDPACGVGPRTDPDDCFALLLLARSPGIQIVGISTVFGNADVEVTDSIARALAGLLRSGGYKGLVVSRGAARQVAQSRGGGAPDTPAGLALRQALEDGPLVVLALGPLTNLAAVFRERPDLGKRVIQLVAVMGRRRGHLFHPVEGGTAHSFLGHGPVFRDFNFAKDPTAAKVILDAALPLTLVPYEAAREVRLTGGALDRVAASGVAPSWVAARARGWLDHWKRDIGQPGFYPFDLVAAGYVVRPEMARCAPARAWIGKDAGIFGWLGREGLFVRPPAGQWEAEAAAPARYCPNVGSHAGDWLVARLSAGETESASGTAW